MYSVYFIRSRSRKNKRVYVGQSCNVKKRLGEHNEGKVKTTKRDRPWVLIYVEHYTTRYLAQRREKYLKSLYGYRTRKKIIESLKK